VETDNGDPHGAPTFTGDPSALTSDRLDAAAATFVGWHDQVPPATSNKRVDGERAYRKAHRGEAVVLPPSRVYLHEATWLSHDLPGESRLRVVVRGGYYVRALARDLGRLLGCGAHLTALCRTSIGPYVDPGPGRQVEVRGQDVLPWAPTRLLTDQELGDLRQERPIPAGILQPPQWNPPDGFPDPQAPIRGVHLGRLICLLTRGDGGEHLRPLAGFGRGL
jgi:tRNA pseudouridine55 synthase